MRPLVLWGARGQAIVLAEFVHRLGFAIVGLFDDDPTVRSPFAGIDVQAADVFEAWRTAHPGELFGLVAIGGECGDARLEVAARLEAAGVSLATVVHPSAYVAEDARLDAGAQVLAGAVVCARAHVGRCAIVNTRASVDHESVLGAAAHIGPGATLAGCVRVGERAFVGAGAIVLPWLQIGTDAIVAAGAVVTANVADRTVVIGSPARVHRLR